MEEIPKLFSKEELKSLDPDGRDCEMCDLKMLDHDWVVLDYQGFAIFCSNMKYDSSTLPEVVVVEYYGAEEESFSYGSTSNVERLMQTARRNAKGMMKDEVSQGEKPDKIEVYAQHIITFLGPKTHSFKLGDWNQ